MLLSRVSKNGGNESENNPDHSFAFLGTSGSLPCIAITNYQAIEVVDICLASDGDIAPADLPLQKEAWNLAPRALRRPVRITAEEAHLAIEVAFLELRAPVLRKPCAGMVPVTSGSDYTGIAFKVSSV